MQKRIAMAVISLFSSCWTGAPGIAQQIADRLGWPMIEDHQFIRTTALLNDITQEELVRTVFGPRRFFQPAGYDRRHHLLILALRSSVIRRLLKGDALLYGYCGLLCPREVPGTLRFALYSERKRRIHRHAREDGLSENDAARNVEADERALRDWTNFLFHLGPWDPALYDRIYAIDDIDVLRLVGQITERIEQVQATLDPARVQTALHSHALATDVEYSLLRHKISATVEAEDGHVRIAWCPGAQPQIDPTTIESQARRIEGVRTVTVERRPMSSPPCLPETERPIRVLLVDDESEFVTTLAERLETRGFACACACDGPEALEMVADNPPEVMVLDLRMPGMDGLEVLQRMRAQWPQIEVIILTGHGDARDADQSRSGGAFAYLHKPIDIETLTASIRAAGEEVRRPRSEPETDDYGVAKRSSS